MTGCWTRRSANDRPASGSEVPWRTAPGRAGAGNRRAGGRNCWRGRGPAAVIASDGPGSRTRRPARAPTARSRLQGSICHGGRTHAGAEGQDRLDYGSAGAGAGGGGGAGSAATGFYYQPHPPGLRLGAHTGAAEAGGGNPGAAPSAARSTSGGFSTAASLRDYQVRISSSSRKTATDTSEVRLGSALNLYAASRTAGATGSPVC